MVHLTRRQLMIAAGAAGAAASFASCSGSGSGSGGGDGASGGGQSLVWSTWGTPDELTRYEEFNSQFMTNHPEIAVTLQAVPSYGDYHSKLLAQLTSKTAPDLFYIGDDKIGQFVASGRLMGIDEVLDAADSKAKRADFNADFFGAAEMDGKIYAGPNDVNPDALWYDKVALADAGITDDPATLAAEGKWTTEAFLEMIDKLAAADKTGALFWNYWNTHYSWISANGGEAFEGNKFIGADDPKTVAAVDKLAEYFQANKFVVADVLPDGAGADSLFVTHKAGFFAQGRYTIATVKSAGEQDSYDIVDWPSADGTPPRTGVATSYLAINGDTAVADAARLFWQEYLSADGQKLRLSGGGNAVPSIKGADDVVLEDGYPEHAQTFLDMRDRGFADYVADSSKPGLSGDISAMFLDLYQGKASVADTLRSIADLVDEAHQ